MLANKELVSTLMTLAQGTPSEVGTNGASHGAIAKRGVKAVKRCALDQSMIEVAASRQRIAAV
jgi:hypothetical protein